MEEAASQQSIYRLQSIDNQFSYSCVLAALAPGPTQYPEEGRSQAKRASPTFPAAHVPRVPAAETGAADPAELLLVHQASYWFTKPATRLPEALWLSFRPIATSQQGWTLDKCGEEISPFDVVPSGNPQMHAVERGFRYREQQHEFSVELLDVPLIAFGEMSPLSFSRSQPDPSAGIHCSLFNNAWGTNYVQWFSEDMRCRFVIRAS